jgi:hypothetical protein
LGRGLAVWLARNPSCRLATVLVDRDLVENLHLKSDGLLGLL